MIIDIHTHTFPEKISARAIEKLSLASHCQPFTNASNTELLAAMEKAGVDLSVIVPVATNPGQVVKVNDSAAAICEQYQDQGLHSFGCIHPDFDDYRTELARIQSLGLKGIKLHPVYQGVDIDDIRFLRILDRAGELGLIVLTHGGQDIGFPGVVHVSPAQCRRTLEQVGPFTFIIAHMGGWHDWTEVPENLAGTGAFIDTSFSTGSFTPLSDGYWKPGEEQMLDEAGFVSIVRAMGADHVLYGSDSPWSDQKQSIRFIQDSGLSDEEKTLILGENAKRLLKL